jgi:putative membrane protein
MDIAHAFSRHIQREDKFMKLLGIVALATTALSLAACGQKTETAHNTTVTTETAINDALPETIVAPGQAFANTAAASDAFEVETSKLAETNAASAAVKSFAKHMVTAHTESTAKLKNAAAALTPALTPDPTLTADQQAKLDSLKALTGADFDAAYASAQVDAHEKTLAALKDYAAAGDVPQFKEFATALVPTVTAHLNTAKGLKP